MSLKPTAKPPASRKHPASRFGLPQAVSTHTGRLLVGGFVILQGACSFGVAVNAADPIGPSTIGHQVNPFAGHQVSQLGRPIQVANQRVPQPFVPVSRARLQVPQVQNASSTMPSVFLGPATDAFDTEFLAETPSFSEAEFASTARRPARLPLAKASGVTSLESFSAESFSTEGEVHSVEEHVVQLDAEAIQVTTDLPTESVTVYEESIPDPVPQFGNPSAKLASAARMRSHYLDQLPPEPASGSAIYLATQTARSQSELAAKLFQQAQLEYDCAAYASAETSVWQSLEKSAQAIDLAVSMSATPHSGVVTTHAGQSAAERLHRGRRAIIEACDFVGPYAHDNQQSLARLSRSHETPVVREALPPMRVSYSHSMGAAEPLPTANEAVDRYLDFARMQMSEIASQSLLAAQSMDLLAAIRLGRNDSSQLPGPTSICLRRAAVQGQSGNPDLVAKLGHQLADVGLIDEARWALQHSLSIQPSAANAARLAELNRVAARPAPAQYGQSVLAATRSRLRRQPEVITMSPEQFASISTRVIPGQTNAQRHTNTLQQSSEGQQQHDSIARRSLSNVAQTASAKAESQVEKIGDENKSSFVKSFTATFQRKTKSTSRVPAMTASFDGRTQSVANPDIVTPFPSANDGPKPQKTSSRFLPGLKKWW